jgi:TRAP-type C4-dicarboxylate transport system permease small subunit
MGRLLRFTLGLSRLANRIAAISLIFMVLITVCDVILRSFRRPIPGTYELVGFAGAVVIGFSLPFTSWEKGHIIVDFVVQKFSQTWKTIINISTRCLGIFFFVLSGIYLIKVGMSLHEVGEVSLTLNIPFYPVTYGLGICCFLQCLVLFCDILKILGGENE